MARVDDFERVFMLAFFRSPAVAPSAGRHKVNEVIRASFAFGDQVLLRCVFPARSAVAIDAVASSFLPERFIHGW